MLMPLSPRIVPTRPITPGTSSLVTVNQVAVESGPRRRCRRYSARRGEPSGNTVPSTVRAPSSVLSERAIESLKCVRPRAHVGDAEGALPGNLRGVDEVGFLRQKTIEHAAQRRVANERGVALAEVSRIGNLQAARGGPAWFAPANEPSRSANSRNGFSLPLLLGADGRHVDRRQHHAVLEKVAHLLGDADADLLLRLGGGAADVRRGHDVFPERAAAI